MAIPKYMILDNDHLNIKVLTLMLEFFGECVCKVFTSPSQLRDAIKKEKPDIVFCNVTARGCDTRELFNNKEINTPLVFISALSRAEERRLSYLNSSFPYISYPLNIQTIESIRKNYSTV